MTDRQLTTLRCDIAFYGVLACSVAAKESWISLGWLVFALIILIAGKRHYAAQSHEEK